MAQHGKASATLVAEVDDYVRAISSLPGITDKEIRQAATRYSAHIQKMEAANARFAKSTANATDKSIESVTDLTEVVGKIPSVFNGAFGDTLGPIGDMGDMLGMIGSAGTMAAVALGAVAVGIASVLTSSVDLISALPENIGLFRKNAYAAEQARAAMESLKADTMALRVELAGELAPAIRDGSDLLHGLVVAADEAHDTLPDVSADMLDVADAALAMASNLPGVMGALANAGHVALTAADGFREVGRARREATEEMMRGSESDQVSLQHQIDMAAALGLVATAQEGAAYHAARAREAERAAEEARRKAEQERAEALQKAEQAAQELARETKSLMDIEYEASLRLMSAEDQIYARRDRQLEQIYELGIATGQYALAQRAAVEVAADALNQVGRLRAADRAREEAEGVRQATAAAEAAAPAIGAAFDALDEDLGASTTTARGLKEQIAALYEELEGFVADGGKASQKQIEETLDKIAELEEQLRRQQIATVSSVFSSTQSIVGSIGAIAEARARHIAGVYGENSEQAKKAEYEAWQTQKAAGYAQALLSLPVAIAQAWELPWPANIAAIAAAGLGVGAQIAAIESSPPPSLHGGGLADERDYRLKRDELVVSAPQVSRAGGADSVRARIEAPANSSGPTHVHIDFGDHRVVQSMQRQLERVRRDPWLGMAT